MSAELNAEIKRLSNLKQNKDVSTDDLMPIAKLNLVMREFKSNPMFDTTTPDGAKEQELADTRFKSYLESSELESTSDIDTLKSLIFNEILEKRIQKRLNDLAKEDKNPPEKLIKSLVDVQNQKNSIKIKLGIDSKEDEKDELSALQLLQKRVKKHILENKNEFTVWLPWTCEKCGHEDIESYLLYKQVKDFKTMKHSFFIGRYLANVEIIRDVKEGKITKEDAIRYLWCSGQGSHYKLPAADKKWCTDYISWLIENWTMLIDMLKKN